MDQQLLYVGPNHWDKLDQLKVYILEFSSCCLHTIVFVRIAGTIGAARGQEAMRAIYTPFPGPAQLSSLAFVQPKTAQAYGSTLRKSH